TGALPGTRDPPVTPLVLAGCVCSDTEPQRKVRGKGSPCPGALGTPEHTPQGLGYVLRIPSRREGIQKCCSCPG
uniref:Uncharacterized protein n=1 Tax=Catharus ustulatus TaxID=91951 RepID=A0A8C3TSE4_CATUS